MAEEYFTETFRKNEVIAHIAAEVGATRQDVQSMFDSLNKLVRGHLHKRGSGEFTVPELGLKLKRETKNATKERKGRNPKTGEEIVITAKPSKDVVKVTIMKTLKEMVEVS